MAYLNIVSFTDAQEKILLIQHLEGNPLTFVEEIAEEFTERECIERMLLYVRLS